tara:strand:- start:520 stop:1077 length:558 start_codon:yes stop_codon:yes gene_type:complete
MGFDLNGIRPNGQDKPDAPDWTRKDNEEEKKAYFAWQTNTPGAYFRANVWGWRPIWEAVFVLCNDILTPEDYNSGGMNDGYVIDEDKASKIAKKLKYLNISKMCEEREKYLNSLPLEECEICKGTGHRNDEIVQGKCNACNTPFQKEKGIPVGKQKNWECNYPLHKELFEEFIKFCEKSGGFEIW